MIFYCASTKHLPSSSNTRWGILGGLCNGACAFFFMEATSMATGVERTLIFPLFSISLIISCNLWAKALYQESIHWRANALCIVGICTGYLES
ncbi:MAG: hypothetical protein LLF94_08905 [Chlamydiales bacterium]|nr:hypothetical protein [Chlamydiales bacterium]